MTNDEFKTQMDVIVGQAQVAIVLGGALDFETLKTTCDRAVDFGPFVDPTKWMTGGRENAENNAKLVRAYEAFVKVARELAKDGP